jgi:Tol biopolymer transport system component
MKRYLVAGLAALVGLSSALVPASAEAAARPRSGSVIVFISDRDSPPNGPVLDELYAYDMGTGVTSRLTDSVDAKNLPVISPSGRYLAYARFDGFEFCRFRATDSGWACDPTRRITFFPQPTGKIAWAPDERSVFFAAQGPGEPDSDIFRARLAGVGSAVNLTDERPGDPELPDFQPAVSPDGRTIVFSRAGDLWRSRSDGSRLVQFTSTPAPVNEFGAEFSPDGRRLAFHSNRAAAVNPGTDGFDVYTMQPRPESATNRPTDVTSQVTGPAGASSRERFPSFSPDGQRIAFWASYVPTGNPNTGSGLDLDSGEIYTIRADSTGVANLTNNNGTEPGAPLVGDIFPDWGRVQG